MPVKSLSLDVFDIKSFLGHLYVEHEYNSMKCVWHRLEKALGKRYFPARLLTTRA